MSKQLAIQGLPGSYTEIAAYKLAPKINSTDILYCKTFREVFDAVKSGAAQRGVVAFANTRLGFITEPFSILTGHETMHDFWVDGGTTIPVNHCLAALPGATLKGIKHIVTQPEAFRQCGDFVGSLNGGVQFIEGKDTALSAKEVSESGKRDIAAICSEAAAKLYNLHILKQSIQDDRLNLTRFVSFTKAANALPTGPEADNSIAIMTISQAPGSLVKGLRAFEAANVNLKTIQSRYIPNTPLEIDIVIEFECGIKDPRMKQVKHDLAYADISLTIIGSYKAAKKGNNPNV